ncbi:hypothetical protein ACTXT7_016171 [Hymenolepis weldensis]
MRTPISVADYTSAATIYTHSKGCDTMGLNHLTLIVLVFALAALTVATVLPQWHCGSLFEDCTHDGAGRRDVMLGIACCLVIGVTMLAIVCIIDFIHICSKTRSKVENVVRLTLLYIGSILCVSAVILYTVEINQSWSYFLATCGAVFATQVCLLTLIYARCCGKHTAGVRIVEQP